MQVRWIVPPQARTDCGESALEVSTRKIVELWLKDDRSSYINYGGQNGIDNRYARIGRQVEEGKEIVMPVVGFDSDGSFGITDGRHRIAWCRDNAIETIQVWAPTEDHERLVLLAGPDR